ncbi:hypothetical protein C8Q79DRAFT_904823 [Trametes meyenii]|nr:hypothetical protein C8Q79DRAFT_904823 [Trametes meyenii]
MFFPFLSDPIMPRVSSSTSAYRALQVEEVLSTIFRHLSPYVWDRQVVLTFPDRLDIDPTKDFTHLGVDASPCSANQQTLVQCSRVSRLFAPHALKVLWRTLPDLRPLQYLLEAMKFSYADLETGTPVHTLPANTIDPSHAREWRRYRWYAACVIGVRDVIDYNTLEEWSDKGGPPLLSRLQSARFRLDPRSINRTLRLLAPSIRDLTLNFDPVSSHILEGSRPSAEVVLKAVAERAPEVEVLNVIFRAPPKDPSTVLPRFPRLRVLIITGWMTPSLHQDIEAYDELELLYVKLYWTRRAEANLQNLQIRRFHRVKTLVALTLSEPIISALQVTDFPLLENARLEVWPHSSDATEGLTHIMEYLHTRAPKMRSFVINTRSAAKHGDRPPPRLVTVLAPLLAHSALDTLSLTLEDNYTFAISCEDILSFASAWPNLVTLTLAHAPTRNTEALPPIVSFLALANACPRLETLVLCARFDCTARDSWREALIPPHGLRELFLGLDAETGSYRPDKTWRALAAMLDRCFPRLHAKYDLVRPAVVGVQTAELWQTVMQHLREIQAGGRRSLSPEL